jgi:integrase
VGKRRAADTGSVTPVASGHWARLRISGKRESLGVYQTPEEADEVIAGVRQKLAEHRVVAGVTLRTWGQVFLDKRESDVRSSSTDRSRWRTHVDTAPFADWSIDSIDPPDVEIWLQDELQRKLTQTPYHKPKPISRKTCREVIGLLSRAYDAAIRRGLAKINPCAAIKVRMLPRTEEPWTYLHAEEQEQLLTCWLIPEHDRVIIANALGIGFREGEQFNLELPDVHAFEPEPYLTVRYGSRGKPPKNGKIRRVDLFGVGLQAMRRWLEILPRYAPANPHRLVFPTPGGARRGPGKNLHGAGQRKGKNVKIDFFREHLRSAGIKRHVRWQDLRHTCASALVSGMWGRTWRLEEVMVQLGHSNISITQRYAHLAPRRLQELGQQTPGLPGLWAGYGSGCPSVEITGKSRVGRQGLEPWTYGLKAPSDVEQNQTDRSTHNPAITQQAEYVLRAIAEGRDGWQHLGVALAETVHEEPATALALDVLDGDGPLEARVTALAAEVLRRATQPVPVPVAKARKR